MKKIFYLFFFALSLSIAQAAPTKKQPTLTYQVDISDPTDDFFKITLILKKKLKPENAIYQFASTAPGTYQIMDIGRFVSDFKVFDKKGKELKTEHISVNQWKIASPEQAKKITYKVADIWDTEVSEHRIYQMCGTSLEKDHALINGQGIFGYPTGMQTAKLKIKIDYPKDWTVGTALSQDKKGYFLANSYDHIVDSPILLGRLTKASTTVAGANVDIYTYSKTDKITSEQLLTSMKDMLTSAASFIGKLPVNRYTFLFHFEDRSEGAWEHSYSSEYIYKEQEFTKAFGQEMTDVAAHEFFHVVTPLNIHSEIIGSFNFVKPVASEHLWLYEGTTEWASLMMQLRGKTMNIDHYLGEMSSKLRVNEHFDSEYSLSKLSLTSYTNEGQKQYGNIYFKGALVAGLLDIRLLELSGGKKGLREVVAQLATKYGATKSFDEATFFKTFVEMTYPEIADFFEKYVKNATALPVKEYYSKIGINYDAAFESGVKTKSLGLGFTSEDGQTIILKGIHKELEAIGLKSGDTFVGFNGETVEMSNIRGLVGKMKALEIGDTYKISVMRDGETKTFDAKVLSIDKIEKYKFSINEKASAQQKALYEAWLQNL